MELKINKSWEAELCQYLKKEEFKNLINKIRADYLNIDRIVYPASSNLFKAFDKTPFKKVSVVILGQDPYHNPSQAHGLCFSVPSDEQAPPSLLNIFKELKFDISVKRTNTDLSNWAEQGVLLLNSTLSVLKNQPTSHSGLGWENFTDYVIEMISNKKEHTVFILWGAYARSKKRLIDTNKHLVLEAPHPSPLSAHRGFFGCRHFSKTNKYLKSKGLPIIRW